MLIGVLIAGLTISTIGKVLLAIAVIRVHWHIFKEHRIDEDVISTIKKERKISIVAIAFLIVGFLIEVMFYLNSALVI